MPHELYEAAEVDGAGAFPVFFRIVLPIIRPGLAALGVWILISTWNDFQLPLVILTDQTKFTRAAGADLAELDLFRRSAGGDAGHHDRPRAGLHALRLPQPPVHQRPRRGRREVMTDRREDPK